MYGSYQHQRRLPHTYQTHVTIVYTDAMENLEILIPTPGTNCYHASFSIEYMAEVICHTESYSCNLYGYPSGTVQQKAKIITRLLFPLPSCVPFNLSSHYMTYDTLSIGRFSAVNN
ncbi:hypothetical protein EYC84_000300 [Monilinia fructicola]|uniref:Uncharacterized protein n=1 Tax=Monilinia fructicola TaxID=38448 RepID=A0A5M9JS79_MONFR|nr:hypothetical protein EYC84_000300 [Monilinia fructicola]